MPELPSDRPGITAGRRGYTHSGTGGLTLSVTRQKRTPMPTEIDRHDVQRLVAAGAQLVDVMPKAEWEESHLTGAVHVPLKKLRELAPERLDLGRAAIVYCYDSL